MRRLAFIISLICIAMASGTAYAFDSTGSPITMGNTAGDRISIMSDLVLNDGISGDAVAILGNVTVNAPVDGDVVSIFGNVIVNSDISGDVVSVLGNVILKQNVEIKGDVVGIGGIQKAADSNIGGEEVNIRIGNIGENAQTEDVLRSFSWVLFAIFIVIGFLAIMFGLIILTAARDKFDKMADEIQWETGKKFSIGLLLLLASPLMLILSIITVIGPPILLIVLKIVLFIGGIVFSIYLGRKVFCLFHTETNIYVEYIAGMAILISINASIILLSPYTGIIGAIALYSIFSIAVNSIGLGTIAVTKFGSSL
jgi:hypothetical protein